MSNKNTKKNHEGLFSAMPEETDPLEFYGFPDEYIMQIWGGKGFYSFFAVWEQPGQEEYKNIAIDFNASSIGCLKCKVETLFASFQGFNDLEAAKQFGLGYLGKTPRERKNALKKTDLPIQR